MSQETLRSNVWSNETLQLGAEALKHQLVKVEEEDLEKSLEEGCRSKIMTFHTKLSSGSEVYTHMHAASLGNVPWE